MNLIQFMVLKSTFKDALQNGLNLWSPDVSCTENPKCVSAGSASIGGNATSSRMNRCVSRASHGSRPSGHTPTFGETVTYSSRRLGGARPGHPATGRRRVEPSPRGRCGRGERREGPHQPGDPPRGLQRGVGAFDERVRAPCA